jgi:hypothetical protein
VLPDKDQRVREHVHGDGQPSTRHTHHEFMLLEFIALVVED